MKWKLQIVGTVPYGTFFFLIEFTGSCFFHNFHLYRYRYLNNMGWIRIRMDPEILPGSGSGTWKIQSWIRIWNNQFRIHNTALKFKP